MYTTITGCKTGIITQTRIATDNGKGDCTEPTIQNNEVSILNDVQCSSCTYTPWTTISTTTTGCKTGILTQTRTAIDGGKNDCTEPTTQNIPTSLPNDTSLCPPCTYTPWEPLSTTITGCKKGIQTQFRTAVDGGKGDCNEPITQNINISIPSDTSQCSPCSYTLWTPISTPVTGCKTATQIFSRTAIDSGKGDCIEPTIKNIPISVPSDTTKCPPCDFYDYAVVNGPCSVQCGGGTSIQSWSKKQTSNCNGDNVIAQNTIACNITPCCNTINYSDYTSSDGECIPNNGLCGAGKLTRTWTKKSNLNCIGSTIITQDNVSCNTTPCCDTINMTDYTSSDGACIPNNGICGQGTITRLWTKKPNLNCIGPQLITQANISCNAKPCCTSSDYVSSANISADCVATCGNAGTYTISWNKKSTSSCQGGLSTPPSSIANCPSIPPCCTSLDYVSSANISADCVATCGNAGTYAITWNKKSTSSCQGGLSAPPSSIANCPSIPSCCTSSDYVSSANISSACTTTCGNAGTYTISWNKNPSSTCQGGSSAPPSSITNCPSIPPCCTSSDYVSSANISSACTTTCGNAGTYTISWNKDPSSTCQGGSLAPPSSIANCPSIPPCCTSSDYVSSANISSACTTTCGNAGKYTISWNKNPSSTCQGGSLAPPSSIANCPSVPPCCNLSDYISTTDYNSACTFCGPQGTYKVSWIKNPYSQCVDGLGLPDESNYDCPSVPPCCTTDDYYYTDTSSTSCTATCGNAGTYSIRYLKNPNSNCLGGDPAPVSPPGNCPSLQILCPPIYFRDVGTTTWTSPVTKNIQVLVVGGGGNSKGWGGGGGGEVIYNSSYSVKKGVTYTITVGDGGQSSIFDTIVANSGYSVGFASYYGANSGNGNAGGGRSTYGTGGGGNGEAGGGVIYNNGPTIDRVSYLYVYAGTGGIGTRITMTGVSSKYYGGGGGGGTDSEGSIGYGIRTNIYPGSGSGGSSVFGGGGNGGSSRKGGDGLPNTGGGAGGGVGDSKGGSGIVILSWS